MFLLFALLSKVYFCVHLYCTDEKHSYLTLIREREEVKLSPNRGRRMGEGEGGGGRGGGNPAALRVQTGLPHGAPGLGPRH